MQALLETTVWDGSYPNHTYLLDGDKLVAYIRAGTNEPYYFKSPIKGFDRRGRKFEKLTVNPFEVVPVEAGLITITGSKGNVYTVNPIEHTCTCPGFQFRGDCKHVKELA